MLRQLGLESPQPWVVTPAWDDGLPKEPIARRKALDKLKIQVGRVAEGLAQMHKAFGGKDAGGNARLMTDDAKKTEYTYLAGPKLERVRTTLGDQFDSVKDKIIDEVIPDFVRAPIPASNNLGDANAGNFIVGENGQVRVIDVGLMRWSVDTAGHGTGTGAADMARFVESLGSLHPDALTDAALGTLRAEFETSYASAAGVNMAEFKLAERYYQVDMYLGILKDDPARILPKLLAVLGL